MRSEDPYLLALISSSWAFPAFEEGYVFQNSFMVQERPSEDIKQNSDTSFSLFKKCMWVTFLSSFW